MEPIDNLNPNNTFVDDYFEKEDVIKKLYSSVLTRTIKEIDEKKFNLIETSIKYENEINKCIDISNYYINEAFSSALKTEELRRKLRIHIYTVFNDGDKETNYPVDVKIENSENIYKYAIPSSFTFNIHGYILNKDENDYDSSESENVRSKKVKFENVNGNNLITPKEDDCKYSGTEIDDISENNEKIDYCNTNVMKFTSFFSTIMVVRDKETIIYDKKNKNYYDCDKLTFTRIINERKKEIIKIFLFLDQKIPFFELSPDLKNLMKSSEETMPEIIKRIYEYSLENDLVGSNCVMQTDEVLKPILEVDEYEFSDLPNLLQKHLSIQKPIVLEHIVDLENEDESESIYDVVIDIFEPYMTLDEGKYKKFVLDSHHLNNLVSFLKINEINDNKQSELNEGDDSKKSTKYTNNPDQSCKIESHEDSVTEGADEINKNGNDENVNVKEENDENTNVNVNNDNKSEYTQSIKEESFDNNINELHNNKIKNTKKNMPSCISISIFEKINDIQNEINSIDDDIINILCKIKQKNSLRLRYTNFYENPCVFIDHVMNSKFPNNMENLSDHNYIYDQSANINDDNYYTLPWVHRGISKYLLIKNKNIDDVLKSVLNSMNLDYKRKIDDINSNGNTKKKVNFGAENFNQRFKEHMNYNYNNSEVNNNHINNNVNNINHNNINGYDYFGNKNMNYNPSDFLKQPMQNYPYNNMSYENNMSAPMDNYSSSGFNNNMQPNQFIGNMNPENNYMQNNDNNFNVYNNQQISPYQPQYMNFPFNGINPQNNFNSVYDGNMPMDIYSNNNFYNSNNLGS
ncbi:SWI/SNF-related matrix-associated actin-dependent regulator of chromatin [Plasmodium berghei]|uniref:SWIB/MDM2 domain-containing protein, putative n=2 Tax=Plasmodium berghei TaxID=5821 RepID=A0A509AJA1_PLABA|nr:SWIB/MDM2 domain-containing protein, putative [Plasmodium berghei ANKA]CXH82771.1 SWI/SNF-related matrix-associated actin-dependent regulator of chromatin [Plasmodium berghei]SCM19229.1 SWI/SNF-related matrix-associated actin-dependent regulator of chromatin [Plasmodium berghei]SCN21667.1 SWI/SNF-related matrix-associated actin-dependent regulator of chromatin [Plasmodium berghei]SCO58903.1 SWI/SNF-related matrix-associated actin-dependent regulator of chromatin [Plasmodium berghei]SCO58966|eukprot:XP_034419697.1 SWIB/MDM2 domain-containing protein, putative [Plasmodium berghei ANKA]